MGSEQDFCRRLTRHFDIGVSCSRMVELDANELLYSQGSVDKSVYLVLSGAVKSVGQMPNGKRFLLDVFRPGSLLGESCLVQEERAESAVAMSGPTVLRCVTRADFRRALRSECLQEHFTRYLLGSIVEQNRRIAELVTMDSRERLVEALLRLAGDGRAPGRPDLAPIEHPVTQEELAELVGTTRSRVGLFLKELRAERIIHRLRGRQLWIDMARAEGYLDERAGNYAATSA